MTFSEEQIFDTLKNEKKTGELLTLPKDFYKQTQVLLNKEGNDARQRQNMEKTINLLKEKRTEKILTYLAYKKTPPMPMPDEEEALYNQIKKILKGKSDDINTTMIKIITRTPQIVTTSGNKLGPFEQNQVVELFDGEDVKFIIENKIGETINL